MRNGYLGVDVKWVVCRFGWTVFWRHWPMAGCYRVCIEVVLFRN